MRIPEPGLDIDGLIMLRHVVPIRGGVNDGDDPNKEDLHALNDNVSHI